jgi:hypothetical protein
MLLINHTIKWLVSQQGLIFKFCMKCAETTIHELVGTSEYGDEIVAHWLQRFSLFLSETAEFCARRQSFIHISH